MSLPVPKRTSVTEVDKQERVTLNVSDKVKSDRFVSRPTQRIVFQRDGICQYKDPVTQKMCGSKHQLEVHHRQPIWAGGKSDQENLQLQCRTHNLHTYREEAQIKLL